MINYGPCPLCGLDMDAVGLRHRCVRHIMVQQTVADRRPEPVAVITSSVAALPHEPTTYRYRDAANRRAYQREYMKRKRKHASASH